MFYAQEEIADSKRKLKKADGRDTYTVHQVEACENSKRLKVSIEDCNFLSLVISSITNAFEVCALWTVVRLFASRFISLKDAEVSCKAH